MNGDDVCGLLVKLGLDQGVFKYLPLDCMDEDTVIRLWMSLESGLSNPQGMLVQRLKRKEVAEGQPKPQELWRACEGGYVQLIETPQKLIDCRNADVNFNNTGVNIGDDHIPVGEFENIMLRFSGGEG
ncbi:MAG: hypothetical protein MI744_19035 [Pseudomonadales bacterium]|nr:hypothetical protein [Pseudomonadales bacterium]